MRRSRGEVVVDLDDGSVTLLPPPELDLASEPWLATTLARAEALPAATVVLDLRGVRFVDHRSTVLVARWGSRLRRSGRRLEVRCAPAGMVLVARLRGVAEELGLEPAGPARSAGR